MADQIVNELTFQAATVNGSGSQSSNSVLMRAIFSMGIPVAPKNIFPSNIEGLPTWFQVRVSPRGYQARRGAPDVVVALNPATWRQDVATAAPGAAIVHEAGYPTQEARTDVHFYPVPFAQLAKTRIDNDKLRKQLANMLYVGVVARLLEIPIEAIETGLRRHFQSKPKAVGVNLEAIQVGIDYFDANLTKQDLHVLRPLTGQVDGLVLAEGNQAAALGCLMGGCTVAAWYPITPSSSLCEYLGGYADRYRVDAATGERRIAIVQAEDELAAVGMAIGAGWAGGRAMTSTSGPGLSLMAEFAGFAAYAEVPVVIFDIQRVGPSTGLPTRTSQGDVAFAYTLGHGDVRHVVLLPGTVEECYEFAMAAFDLAEKFQCPVFVLSDLDLGMNWWMTRPFAYPEQPFERGKVLHAQDLERLQGDWGRYRDVDGDGIPYRTLPGTEHPQAGYFTRGSGHDENARYTESSEVYARNLDRLARKHDSARAAVPAGLAEGDGGVAILAFGSTHHAVVEARDELAAAGCPTAYMRVRALPFGPEISEFVASRERVYVVEQNRDGQLHDLLRAFLPPELAGRLRSVRSYDGQPIAAAAIVGPVLTAESRLVTA